MNVFLNHVLQTMIARTLPDLIAVRAFSQGHVEVYIYSFYLPCSFRRMYQQKIFKFSQISNNNFLDILLCFKIARNSYNWSESILRTSGSLSQRRMGYNLWGGLGQQRCTSGVSGCRFSVPCRHISQHRFWQDLAFQC
jgi:hypothetical protein